MSSWGNESNTEMQAPGLPEPVATELSLPHWQGCAAGKLLVQQCSDCNNYTFPPEPVCPHCLTNTLQWQASSGKGTLYSFSVVHRPQTPAFNPPYVVAIIALNEGWHMLSNIIDTDEKQLSIGQAVEVDFIKRGNSHLPCFKPVGT